jgi:LAS superfamily LD-carboxypeptidase LdcB
MKLKRKAKKSPMINWYWILILGISLSCGNQEMNNKEKPSNTNISKDTIAAEVLAVPLDYLMGQFDPAQHSGFSEIPEEYADRPGLYLRKEALDAFIRMSEAATKENIQLQIRSATRNFDYQKKIWEAKWKGETLLSDGTNVAKEITNPKKKALKILLYSSMPGTSRHHWGTDIDLNSFNNGWFEKGDGLVLYNWLQDNAATFGFCQPYTPLDTLRPTGYQEEKWHWSYIPLSRTYTAAAEVKLKDDMITGFAGSETASSIGVVKNYILGINKNCK